MTDHATPPQNPFVLRYRRMNGFCTPSLNSEFPPTLRYLRANGNSCAEAEVRT